MNHDDDLIAAIATPPGQGGVAIVRLSGPGAIALGGRAFRPTRPVSGDSPGAAVFQPYRMRHGHALDAEGRPLDEVLAVAMPGPRSYTGQDVFEIHCHGGRGVSRAILESLFAQGARPAARGEFTRRAFTSGRLDLTQAEAVAELIAAPGPAAARLARTKLDGALGSRVRAVRERLVALKTEACVAVDFPEDELECLPPGRFTQEVESAAAALSSLLAAFARARPGREGALVALTGEVNVGKSSLLNAILGRERAIVSAIPGTTRDAIEETLILGGVEIHLVDTAGLREETADSIEHEGMDRARRAVADADLVLLVLDGSRAPTPAEIARARELVSANALVVINKADLPAAPDWPPNFPEAQGLEALRLSARSGQGVTALCDRLACRAAELAPAADEELAAPGARQAEAIARALDDLSALAAEASAGLPYDLLGVRLDHAVAALGEVTGEIAPAEVLDRIFESFCVGK